MREAVEERRLDASSSLDSLNAYLHAMPGEQYLILQMHELLNYLNQQGVTTLLVLGPARRHRRGARPTST